MAELEHLTRLLTRGLVEVQAPDGCSHIWTRSLWLIKNLKIVHILSICPHQLTISFISENVHTDSTNQVTTLRMTYENRGA